MRHSHTYQDVSILFFFLFQYHDSWSLAAIIMWKSSAKTQHCVMISVLQFSFADWHHPVSGLLRLLYLNEVKTGDTLTPWLIAAAGNAVIDQLVCVTGQWRCKDELTCIPEKYVCNGEIDCYDGSDELGCGNVHNWTKVCMFRQRYCTLKAANSEVNVNL